MTFSFSLMCCCATGTTNVSSQDNRQRPTICPQNNLNSRSTSVVTFSISAAANPPWSLTGTLSECRVQILHTQAILTNLLSESFELIHTRYQFCLLFVQMSYIDVIIVQSSATFLLFFILLDFHCSHLLVSLSHFLKSCNSNKQQIF